MARIQTGRLAPTLPADGAVVFLIGMRFNRLWQVWKWFPVFMAMGRMLAELAKHPDLGLMGRPRTFLSGRTLLVLQHWTSFDALESYARASDRAHLPAWSAFNRAMRGNTSVGIWHETYLISPTTAEAVYVNMPAFGLGAAFGTQPAEGSVRTAAQRLGRS